MAIRRECLKLASESKFLYLKKVASSRMCARSSVG